MSLDDAMRWSALQRKSSQRTKATSAVRWSRLRGPARPGGPAARRPGGPAVTVAGPAQPPHRWSSHPVRSASPRAVPPGRRRPAEPPLPSRVQSRFVPRRSRLLLGWLSVSSSGPRQSSATTIFWVRARLGDVSAGDMVRDLGDVVLIAAGGARGRPASLIAVSALGWSQIEPDRNHLRAKTPIMTRGR
jgi:hypothetical protein